MRTPESRQAIVQSNIKGQRSLFPINFPVKDTANAADLNVLTWFEILPGDTISIDISGIIRANPSIHPTMDTAFIEVFPFFVPNRIVWDNWEDFRTGGDEPTAWLEHNDLAIPQIEETQISVGGLGDSFGLPIIEEEQQKGIKHSVLPYRGYYAIYNKFFRDENLQEELPEETGDSVTITYEKQKANKYHDLFTSALPGPQKGPAVEIGLAGYAPVTGDRFIDVGVTDNKESNRFYAGTLNYGNSAINEKYSDTNTTYSVKHFTGIGGDEAHEQSSFTTSSLYKVADMSSGSFKADLSQATAMTINEIRLAFQTQLLLEALARGGSRYIEFLSYIFNVDGGDYRLQRPEYITGGNRVPIGMKEVAQTSETTTGETGSPLATVAGLSVTRSGNFASFTYSSKEDGMLIILYCIRNMNSYAQSLDKKWTKTKSIEFYTTPLANIGEVPIKKQEVAYIVGSGANKDIFGSQEAWYEYRYFRAETKGQLRPGITGSLAAWTYVDYFEESPELNEEFLQASKTNIQNTLAIQEGADQFICAFNLKGSIARKMPVTSIPGRIDHAW